MTDQQSESGKKNREYRLNRRTVLRAGGVGLAGVLGGTSWATRSAAAASPPSGETGVVTVDDGSTIEIDGYDAGSLGAYEIEDERSYALNSSVTRGGSGCSLEWVANTSGFDYAVSTSGLEQYPTAGDTWEFFVRCSGVTDWQGDVYFCAQSAGDAPDSYSVRLTHSTLELEEWNAGAHVSGSKSGCSWPVDEWCRVEVTHADASQPTLTARAYDASGTKLGETSYTATNTYSSGGFGYRSFADNVDTVYIDDVRMAGGGQTVDSEWRTVSLNGSYDSPIVLVKPVSTDSDCPVHTRVRNVSTDSFEYKLETWQYQDAKGAGTAHYAVVEAGTHTLPDGSVLEAGTTTVDDAFGRVTFDAAFPSSPVVFSQAQTYNDSEPIVTRNMNVSADGFKVGVQEEEALGSHAEETVGYLAVQPTTGSGYEIGCTAEAVTDQWYELPFEGSHDSPVLLADVQTANGWQPAGLRYANLSDASVDVHIEEERSEDDETNHIAERVGYLVATPGSLFGSGGSDGSDSSGSSDGSSYYDGARLYSSDYRSLQAAINDASATDTVVVDTNHTISSRVSLKSDLKVEGGGGTITFKAGSNTHGLDIRGLSNVWIDGVEIDGNRSNQSGGGYGLGGPGDNGNCQNIRITNCHLYELHGDGINLLAGGSASLNDVYLADNRIEGVNQHGIVVGATEATSDRASSCHDIIIENNHITGMVKAQGIGVFGHGDPTGEAYHVAILGNEVGEQGGTSGGQAMSFEQVTHHNIRYGNRVYDWNAGNGMAITKSGDHNVNVHNLVENCPGGFTVQNFKYYEPNGPPENNIYSNNHSRNNKHGLRYWRCNNNNVYYYNRVEGCNARFNTNNGVRPRVERENTSSTPTAETGIPDTIGDGVTTHTPDGQVGVEASWSRGGPHPDEPVTVTVDAYPERY